MKITVKQLRIPRLNKEALNNFKPARINLKEISVNLELGEEEKAGLVFKIRIPWRREAQRL